MWLILLKIYIVLLAGVSIIGISRYRIIDTPAKIIVILLTLTTISETLAQILSLTIKNNLLVYHIFSPIQFVLLSLFFNYQISFFKKHYIGIVLAVIGLVLSVINSIFIQHPLTTFNSYFLVVESILVIGMTLCYFYDFLNTTHITKQFTTPHFWMACILLLFWSFTFFIWLVGETIPSVTANYVTLIRYMMYTINMITYTGFGVVFLFYKKLQPIE